MNKTILVTGSTDGIGLQTACDLAELGAQVIMHGRNKTKAEQVANELISKTGNKSIEYVYSDLSSFDEVIKMSEKIHQRFKKIDVLINNAGIYKTKKELSGGGLEITFAVNHLSYYLLTGLLLDIIEGRIVNVASQAHADQLDFENLQGEKYFDGYDAYSRSKLCNILFTFKLAELIKSTGVTVNVLHPGVISTKLLHEGWGSGGTTLKQGSKTSVFLAVSPEVASVSGKYFSNLREIKPSSVSYEKEIQERLWTESEKLTGFIY